MAGNEPSEELSADPFEGALADRINFVIKTPNSPDTNYFMNRFDKKIANVVLSWWNEDLDTNQKNAISPRRLEYIGKLLENKEDPFYADISRVMNSRVILPWDLLSKRLDNNFESTRTFISNVDLYASRINKDNEMSAQFIMCLDLFKHNELYKITKIIQNMRPDYVVKIIKNNLIWERILSSLKEFSTEKQKEEFEEAIYEIVQKTKNKAERESNND